MRNIGLNSAEVEPSRAVAARSVGWPRDKCAPASSTSNKRRVVAAAANRTRDFVSLRQTLLSAMPKKNIFPPAEVKCGQPDVAPGDEVRSPFVAGYRHSTANSTEALHEAGTKTETIITPISDRYHIAGRRPDDIKAQIMAPGRNPRPAFR
jgi:hypothetical protein